MKKTKEIDQIIEQRRALVAQLNTLQERHTENPYDENVITNMMQTKESINKITYKLNCLTFKDKERD